MQDRINELMGLSVFELQKQALATLIAVIEAESTYDDVKIEAIKALPEVQESVNDAMEYYDDTYEEIYDDVIEDVADALGYTDEDCVGVCTCEDDCEDCETEGWPCAGKECPSYSKEGEEDEEAVVTFSGKPPFCTCDDECDYCNNQIKQCIGRDCPKCKNPQQDDEE